MFIPRVNRVLLLGVLALVLMFRTSSALANAYGMAVSGTMVVTTALAFFVVWRLWRWPLWGALALVCAFLSIDVSFLVANLYKVFDGGWVPLLLGAAMFIVMWTWIARQRASSSPRPTAIRSRWSTSSRCSTSPSRCGCRARRSSSPATRGRALVASCTISSTTRCCTSGW